MKKIEKDNEDWFSNNMKLDLIGNYLDNPNDYGAMFKLLCIFDNVKCFEIEDKEFLDCINTKLGLDYDNVVSMNTNEVLIRNYLSKYIFEFDRLLVNVACKNDFDFDSNKYYTKDEINDLISKKVIYPVNYKYVALDYVPTSYTTNRDEKLNTPYLWKSNYFDESTAIHEKELVFYDYFINKIKGEYDIIGMIKDYLNYLYYDEYVRCIEYFGGINDDYKSYFNEIYEVRDRLNDLCSKNNEEPIQLLTMDSLYDYLVSQINVPKEERYKYVGRNNVISLLEQIEFKDDKENEKYKDVIIRLNDSKLAYGLIINYSNSDVADDLIEILVNNNDASSCYELLMDYSSDFDGISLYKMFKVVLLSCNIDYINDIKNTELGKNLCENIEYCLDIDKIDSYVYKLIKSKY